MFLADLWYVHRACAGDTKAFDTIFVRYSSRIYNLLRRLGASPGEAEDLSQETFVDAYRSLSTWRRTGALSAWLCGIAANRYRHFRRANGFNAAPEPLDETLPALPDSDPLARLARSETADALHTAIRHLPDSCREAFVLIYIEQFSYKEAAQLLEIPVGTVQSRLNRAKGLLHSELSATLAESNTILAKGTKLHVPEHLV